MKAADLERFSQTNGMNTTLCRIRPVVQRIGDAWLATTGGGHDVALGVIEATEELARDRFAARLAAIDALRAERADSAV
jgi:hypothetical protein